MRCLETSRRHSLFVGEEIYNFVPFLFINYRLFIALDETMKTILSYLWRSKYRNNLRSDLPKKMAISKDRLIIITFILRGWHLIIKDPNTANESSCFRKNLPSTFVLIYPFTSQIFCINNGIMRRFTYGETNRDDLLQYNGINFTLEKWLELPLD